MGMGLRGWPINHYCFQDFRKKQFDGAFCATGPCLLSIPLNFGVLGSGRTSGLYSKGKHGLLRV